MREILFKAKRKVNGKLVEGVYFKQTKFYDDPCEKHYIIVSTESLEYEQALEYYEVIPKTVCQYTGLTDKNGTKIFEGDIVRWADFTMEIFWGDDIGIGCGFCWKPCGSNRHYHESMTGFIDEYEVIGNIHDNPELLEGE